MGIRESASDLRRGSLQPSDPAFAATPQACGSPAGLPFRPCWKTTVAKGHPEVIPALGKLAAEHRAGVTPVPSQLEAVIGKE